MPYINGRYYMNPQYGAAVERAREADEADASEAQFEDSSAPQIEYMSAASQEQPNRTPSPQPRPSASGKAHASQHTPPRAQEHKVEVGYGETFRPASTKVRSCAGSRQPV